MSASANADARVLDLVGLKNAARILSELLSTVDSFCCHSADAPVATRIVVVVSVRVLFAQTHSIKCVLFGHKRGRLKGLVRFHPPEFL
jgi:hypothetical protein